MEFASAVFYSPTTSHFQRELMIPERMCQQNLLDKPIHFNATIETNRTENFARSLFAACVALFNSMGGMMNRFVFGKIGFGLAAALSPIGRMWFLLATTCSRIGLRSSLVHSGRVLERIAQTLSSPTPATRAATADAVSLAVRSERRPASSARAGSAASSRA